MIFFNILLILLFTSFSNQKNELVIFKNVYPCIDYEKNTIGNGTDKYLFSFFNHLDHFIKSRMGKINIVHLGDSHIQADYLTNETRTLFQQTFGNGGRGFIFPFRIANTNNPINYSLMFGGKWSNCKATQSGDACTLGLNGLEINTRDSNSYMIIDPERNGKMDYSFNSLKLFYHTDEDSYSPIFENNKDNNFFFDEQPVEDGYSQFFFNKPQDTVNMRLAKSFSILWNES